MKLNLLSSSIIALVASASANAALTITPMGGYHYPEHGSVVINQNQDLTKTEGHVYGGAIGYEFSNGATQAQIEYLKTESKDKVMVGNVATGDKIKSQEEQYSLNLVHEYGDLSGATSPYFLIGAGHSKAKIKHQNEPTKTDDTIANIGAGVRHYLNENIALRGELRGVHHFEAKKWDGKALVGVEFKFGGAGLGNPNKEIKMAEPATNMTNWEPVKPKAEFLAVIPMPEDQYTDQDGDGVPDHLDACPGTPENVVVDERGCPQTVKVAEELKMELRVFFDKDKAELKPQFVQEVAKVAQQMKNFPDSTARIEGHASKDSNKSSPVYNQRLSQARAAAVKSMLTSQFGIQPNRLTAVGYGFDQPLAPNTTEEGRAINRRVYAIIQGEKVETLQKTKDMQ